MTDVLKIALDRRNKLHDDIKKLDEFIRMADALVRGDDGGQKPATHTTASVPPVPPAPTSPTPAASADHDADESPMRMAARKLSDAEVRRPPDMDHGNDAPRPSIIRRGLAG